VVLRTKFRVLLASLSGGKLSFDCTAHFGQTSEVKLKLCLTAYPGAGGML